MIEFQQLFLIILIFTLTVLLVIFSIFIFRILAEIRLTLVKFNKIMDDMGTISSSIAQPVSGLVSGFRSGFKIFNLFKSKTRVEEEADDGN